MNKKIKPSFLIYSFLLIIAILPLLSMLTPGLPVTHDGQDHVVRIANFYQSLHEGNIVPRWGNNLNWGFGHPVLMFLYPLPSYVASFFHFVGFSFVDSVKIVFAASFVISIVSMFIFARDEWGKEAGVTAAILYGFAPYHFVNLYVRGALGEMAAFVFLPLILWGLKGLATKNNTLRWSIVLSVSLSGLFLGHNAVSIMMIPVCLLYGLYLLVWEQTDRKKFIFSVIFSVLLSIGSSAFFLIPAFFEGKYTLRDIVTRGEVTTRMVSPFSFLYSPWNYGGGNDFTKEIGIPVILCLFITLYFYFRSRDKKIRIFIAGTVGLMLFYLILMIPQAAFVWNSISLLQKFQFPWRLLVITSLLGSLIGGIAVYLLPGKIKKSVTVFIVVITLLTTFQMWKPKLFKTYDESFFTGVYKGTTDTGESSPIWSVRFMEFQPEVPMEVSEGDSTINPGFRNSTVRDYKVNAHSKSRLVENTLYFPGWNIYVDGNTVPIQFQDPQWRGRMTFWVEPGLHTIHIVFSETKLRNTSDVISIFSVVFLAVMAIYVYIISITKKKIKSTV